MTRGKHEAARHGLCRGVVLLIFTALLLVGTVSGSLAWLSASSDPVENTFQPSQVSCEIKETFSNSIKKDVYVTNTSHTEAYIRVAIIPTWIDSRESVVATPVTDKDYLIDLDRTNWIKGTDGYWYCKSPVPAEKDTPILIKSAALGTDNGYTLNLQILAEAIQSKPTDAATEAWNITVDSTGQIVKGGK